MRKKVQLYTAYERFWHWAQAVAILLLLWTGFSIHWGGGVFPFALAVTVHNILGFLLLLNAFLGLFYYLSTGSIRQYMPEPKDFISMAFQQASYYLGGIFRREPHPFEKTPQRRLNPLQRMAYLMILNVLLPLQVVTGVLMWTAQAHPDAVFWAGSLRGLTLIHLAGAWGFAAFVIGHIYLTTTGHTPLANIKAMIFGHEELDVPEEPEAQTAHAKD